MNKYLFFLFIFLGCSERTTSPLNINYLREQQLKIILQRFPNKLAHDNIEYEEKIKLVKNILYKVNYALFSDSNKIKVRFLKAKSIPDMASALPDDTFLVTDIFLEAIDNVLNTNETTAVICHEVAHIFNEDWSERYRNNSSYFNASIHHTIGIPNLANIGIGYFLTRNIANSDISVSNYLTSSFSSFSADETNLIKEKFLDFNIMTIQGFPLSVEINTDKIAMKCLKKLKINPNNMQFVLEKLLSLNISQLINKKQIKIRINKIKEKE